MNKRSRISTKAGLFKESVIREMSRLAARHNALNLAQGLPDFACLEELKEAANQAVNADINQYAITWGDQQIRRTLSEKYSPRLGIKIDPEREITVTCGATEAMVASMMALVDPGDEVIFFEPFYENYGPDSILSGAVPRLVKLRAPSWTFDRAELESAFNNSTRAIIINTPHNPTGKVFDRQELEFIAALCRKWGVYAFTDEIYEHILYDGAEHVSLASIEGMQDLTVTINSLSKTFSVTGWRVGWAIAPGDLTQAIRKVHDFLTVGAPAPLQRAGAFALNLAPSFYGQLAQTYLNKRDTMLEILTQAGIKHTKPEGAYYVMCDISDFGFKSDLEFTQMLVQDVGIAVVPGSSFFADQKEGSKYVRFCFARAPETLACAKLRMDKLRRDKLRACV